MYRRSESFSILAFASPTGTDRLMHDQSMEGHSSVSKSHTRETL